MLIKQISTKISPSPCWTESDTQYGIFFVFLSFSQSVWFVYVCSATVHPPRVVLFFFTRRDLCIWGLPKENNNTQSATGWKCSSKTRSSLSAVSHHFLEKKIHPWFELLAWAGSSNKSRWMEQFNVPSSSQQNWWLWTRIRRKKCAAIFTRWFVKRSVLLSTDFCVQFRIPLDQPKKIPCFSLSLFRFESRD